MLVFSGTPSLAQDLRAPYLAASSLSTVPEGSGRDGKHPRDSSTWTSGPEGQTPPPGSVGSCHSFHVRGCGASAQHLSRGQRAQPLLTGPPTPTSTAHTPWAWAGAETTANMTGGLRLLWSRAGHLGQSHRAAVGGTGNHSRQGWAGAPRVCPSNAHAHQ